MLSYKTKAMGFVVDGQGMGEGPASAPAVKLLGQLGEGLRMILAAVKNYSVAYEALGGMSGMFFPFS